MPRQNYIVKEVPVKQLKDYDGMNYYAGKKLGYQIDKKNVIHVRKGLNSRDKRKTIKHEIVEAELMKKGFSYWTSHTRALKEEDKKIKLSSGRYIRF